MATAAQKRERAEKIDALVKQAALASATIAGASAATAVGAGGAAATLAPGAAAVSTLLVGAAGSAGVPVAGWVVAGGLLAAAGITAIVLAVRKKNRRQAEQVAAQYGEQGKAFVKAYFRLSEKKDADEVAGWLVDKDKELAGLPSGRRDKKRERLLDEINAGRMVLIGMVGAPTQPLVGEEQRSIPVRKAPAMFSPKLRQQVGLPPDQVTQPAQDKAEGYVKPVLVALGLAGLLWVASSYKRGSR